MIILEHNLSVISQADGWVDLGPKGEMANLLEEVTEEELDEILGRKKGNGVIKTISYEYMAISVYLLLLINL